MLGAGDISLIITCPAVEKNPVLYEDTMKLIRQFRGHARLRAVPMLLVCREDDGRLSACDDLGISHITLPDTKSALLAKLDSLCGTVRVAVEGSEPLAQPITIGRESSETVSEQNDSGLGQFNYQQKNKIIQKSIVPQGSEPVKKPEAITIARKSPEPGSEPVKKAATAPKL